MLSLIRKALRAGTLFDIVLKRANAIEAKIAKIDKKLERFEKLADENESLWQYLDEQKENDEGFIGSADEFESEITDIMLRNMKTQGDA